MLELARTMPHLFEKQNMGTRNILRKFLRKQRDLSAMPPDVVWKLLYFGPPP
jgi:hypothetical protein